ncbi:MAG: IS66 family insertion sequence element accessory protein TnpB [Eubacteriales bacterium]|nr:IS66 family insertion sequence element accessory protein TnpB [Eubacteriales bacterium]
MRRKRIYKDEQIKLIMECRSSGLSDHQWCMENDISPGTFYNWISKLRKKGYTIPETTAATTSLPIRQDVVKVDLIKNDHSGLAAMAEQNACFPSKHSDLSPAAELVTGSHILRIYNGASEQLIRTLFTCIGGGIDAW